MEYYQIIAGQPKATYATTAKEATFSYVPPPQRKEVIHQFPRTNHALRARLLSARPTHFRMFQSDTLLLVKLDCDHITTKLGLHFVRLWAHYSCCLLHFSSGIPTLWCGTIVCFYFWTARVNLLTALVAESPG